MYIKKLLCVVLTIILLLALCICPSVTVSAAKTNKYADFIKYRGQDLKNTYAKLSKGEEINVLYYGGSVTNGTGASNPEKYSWRALVGKWLTDSFPKAKINNINVSYGGTGSYFGAYRVKHEVISKKPDLIFIEFAINDHYDNQVRSLSKEKSSTQFETIVRSIWNELPECDIVTVLTTEKGYISINRAGKLHSYAQAHEEISAAYKIPSLHVGRALVSKLSYGDTEGDWNKHMWNNNDIVHPNDKGYAVYFEVFKEYLSNCLKNGGYDGKITKHKSPRVVNERLYDGNVKYIDANEELIKKSNDLGGQYFRYSSAEHLPGYPGGAESTNGINSKFVIEFTGTELAMIQKSTNIEEFMVVVDGKTKFEKNYSIYPEVLVTGLKPGKHTVKIQPVFKDDKSDGSLFIMGFFTRDDTKASAKYDHLNHKLGKYVSNNDATCKKNGTKTAKCTVKGCDYSETVEDGNTKLPHKYKLKVIKKATNKKDGEAEKVCSYCGRFDGIVVIPKGKTESDIAISQTTSTNSETENSKTDGTVGQGSTISSTTNNNTANTIGATQSSKRQEIPMSLKVTLIVVLSLLVIGIGFLIVILIKRRNS